MALFAFMNRRHSPSKRRKYWIIWDDSIAGHVVSRDVFNRAVASRWITPEAPRLDENGKEIPTVIARVAHGVKASLHAGALCLEDMARKALIWIYTSWISIDRDSPVIQGKYFVKEIERQYAPGTSRKVEPDGTWIDRCDWEASS